ncbi:DUF2264 domain-containing protein [Enterococcus sp.]|uniref:DUF2264 domain-containing protein n=1 Tax=Enterococcus sp. TaxID=35783 RepID=UPI002914EBE5|nr:DUF2264 domain-containing protein [Enterococcus sp.]MDU5334048.1 DUF2264 domain-containing protein [Enterococcus sp.]
MVFTKSDLFEYMVELLPKDDEYLRQSGGSYLQEIRQLESILRPFWGIIPACNGSIDKLKSFDAIKKFQKCVEERTLPRVSTENRQIAVEAGVLGYAIGQFGEAFLQLFSKAGRTYLIEWLNQLNQIEFPTGNWYFFLILINGALKEQDLPYSEERLAVAKEGIESFYLGDGWYSDGENQQRDYYVAFAFHFYGLLYSRFSSDPQGQVYVKRAVIFANDFKHWFDPQGRSLPFGRSLTYRFAHISFWSALVVSGAYQKTDLSLGEIKGIIGRNLRFWRQQPIQLPKGKNLSIGYGYNHLILSEDYNAPASPMWAFKAFLLLELPSDDLFWSVFEENLPIKTQTVQPHAGFHITQSAEQTIALSNLQYCKNQKMYHQNEKYTKFAYSTYFGFNLTRDSQNIESFAIDSTLAFSMKGHDQYQSRQTISASKIFPTYSWSRWFVWNELQVETYLVPIDGATHLRIHVIDTPYTVEAIEGGFPLFEWNPKYDQPKIYTFSSYLENRFGFSLIRDLNESRQPDVVNQGPNTNIYSPEKNGIPILKTELSRGKHTIVTLVAGSSKKKAPVEVQFIEAANTYHVKTKDQELIIKKERFR